MANFKTMHNILSELQKTYMLNISKLSSNLKTESATLSKSIWDVYWTLLKIMVPTLLIIRILDSYGVSKWLAKLLSPIMALIGLPESTGLIWATAILTNIYTAMAVFFSQGAGDVLTIAQVSTLGAVILVAHSYPLEVLVAKAAGVSIWQTLLIRTVGAFALGAILNVSYGFFSAFDEPSHTLWRPDPINNDWQSWLISQAEMLFIALLIIIALMVMLRLFQVLGIERLIHFLLTPVLMILGVNKKSANIIVIGTTLGLSIGGGLLIEEAKKGELSHRDVFLSLAFLGLCHSLIEDTLLILLLGADINGILWARLVFSLFVIGIVANVFYPKPEENLR